MLLGVALPEKGSALFDGTLPFDAIEGVRTQVLGKLLGFMDALVSATQQLARDMLDCLHKLYLQDQPNLDPDSEQAIDAIVSPGRTVTTSIRRGLRLAPGRLSWAPTSPTRRTRCRPICG